MPGGILSTVFGHWTNMINIEMNFADKKGRQSIITMKANKKLILIIVFYRIPDGSNQRIYTAKIQWDKVGKKVKLVPRYQTVENFTKRFFYKLVLIFNAKSKPFDKKQKVKFKNSKVSVVVYELNCTIVHTGTQVHTRTLLTRIMVR